MNYTTMSSSNIGKGERKTHDIINSLEPSRQRNISIPIIEDTEDISDAGGGGNGEQVLEEEGFEGSSWLGAFGECYGLSFD
jgi:hypothetical protein